MKLFLGVTLLALLVSDVSFATPPPDDVRGAEAAKAEKMLRPTTEAEKLAGDLQRGLKQHQDAQMRLNMAMLERQKALQRLQIETEGRMDREGLLTICANDVAELLKKDAKLRENNAKLRKNNPKLTFDAAKKKVLACELADTEAAAKKETQIRMQTTDSAEGTDTR